MSASNCPETPRQKMIQMMYLVYTAMLALNVSAEVVNGFKTVGNAMTKSNENLEVKLNDTYDNFKFALDNNREKVQEKYDKAMEVKRISNELEGYIDTVIYDFVFMLQQEASIVSIDADNEKTSKHVIPLANEDKTPNYDSIHAALQRGGFSWINALDNNHKGTAFFMGQETDDSDGAAEKLKAKILEYKNNVKRILGADSTHVSLGLNVEQKEINSEGGLVSWEQLNFDNTVAGAALVTLTRMKAETMNAEFDAVNMLYKQVRSNDFSFDKVAVITRPSASNVMKGGKYELVVNVGAYDSKASFDVNIGGSKYTSNDSGAVVYSTTCNATGPKTISGTVYVKKDNGTEQYDFKQSYYVTEPMAVFELTEMNVVYAGIDNPIKISVPGTAAKDVTAIVSEGQADLVPDKERGAGYYIIKPKQTKGKLVVSVSIKEGKSTLQMGSSEFRVRTIPDPIVSIGKYKSGQPIPINEFKAATGINVLMSQDFAFKMTRPKVAKQTAEVTKLGKEEVQMNGDKWNPDFISIRDKAKAGCKVNIEAQVVLADGSKRNINGSFRIIR